VPVVDSRIRNWLVRIARASNESSDVTGKFHIKIAVTRRVGRHFMNALGRQAKDISGTDGRGRKVRRIEFYGMTIEWLD
jgi:hypothetical protein